MTIPTFSLKLSAQLSSLAPGFEGYWDWCGRYDSEDKLIGEPFVQCEEFTSIDGPREWNAPVTRIICPAWQVEDAIREMKTICDKSGVDWECLSCGHKEKYEFDCTCDLDQAEVVHGSYPIIQRIACMLMVEGDTAYQKIEEYLWAILK